jgi:hypothetical protein
VRGWCTDHPSQLARSRADLGGIGGLTARRGSALDAAYTAVEQRWPDLADAGDDVVDRTVEDLELHLDHLAAALALDEREAYLDLVRWLADVHAGRQLPPAALTAQLDGLAQALADVPRVHDLLDAGRASLP